MVEGLGGVFAGEVARLGCGPEDLLHRVRMHVQLVDGLKGLIPCVGVEQCGWEHLQYSLGVRLREFLPLDTGTY